MWYKLGCDPEMFQVSEKPKKLDDDKVDIAWKNRCSSEFNLLETVITALLFPFTMCIRLLYKMYGTPSTGKIESERSLYTILLLVHKYHLNLKEKEGSDSYDYEYLWWNGKRSSA